MDLNHLHLHVRDVPASQEFYGRYFGLKLREVRGFITYLVSSEGFDLTLSPDPDPTPLPSWFHFGFRLPSADAVRKLHDRMIDDDVHVLHPFTPGPDSTWFRCEDPDGYAIQVYWDPPATLPSVDRPLGGR